MSDEAAIAAGLDAVNWDEIRQGAADPREAVEYAVRAALKVALSEAQAARTAEVVAALREYMDGREVVGMHPAEFIRWRFGSGEREGPRCKTCQDRGGSGVLTPCPECNLYPPHGGGE